ncbi:MAG TPA: ABC transporter ATP-binding protein [Novosphingobium sp.]|nr:ABC transporter ATP-binding protein [Novosphingobium sp.]
MKPIFIAPKTVSGRKQARTLEQLRRLLWLLNRRERINAGILLVLMLFGATLEIAALAAVPAFVSAVVNPEAMRSVPVVGDLLATVSAGFSDRERVLWGALALVGIFAVKNGFLVFNYYTQIRYVANRRTAFAGRLIRTYMAAPYGFHLAHNRSELLRNIDHEVKTLCYQVISTLLDLATKVAILLGVLGFLMVVEPWITLAWVVFVGSLAFAGINFISPRLRDSGLVQQQACAEVNQSLYQALGGIKEIRTLGREQFFIAKIMHAIKNLSMVNRFLLFIGKIIPPASEMAAMTGLLGLSCALVLIGRDTNSILVTISLFVVGLVRLREATSAAMTNLANVQYSLVSVDPIYEDLKSLPPPPPPVARENLDPGLRPHSEIALEDVWLRYDGSHSHALQGVDLVLPVGSAVGLVGRTGAGKSTLVDVLLGLLEPERGSLLVDGRRIGPAELPSWRSQLGYVPQAIYILDDTIRRNIALGIRDEDIDEVALNRAIEDAQLRPFLERQPHGLDTVVGEGGARISGGERQRIGIARALYNNPSVIVLDEATSALDNTTERALIEAVDGMRGHRTVVMIAHRLTTVRDCDMLYYLKDGRVEACGTYDELRRDNHEFREMAA